MAVNVIYKCDKCGNEQNTSEQFWTVGVTANHGTGCSRHFVEDKFMQVCRTCLESFGICVRTKKQDPQINQAIPSVEELIREIIERCS
jgi:hypothetical protein